VLLQALYGSIDVQSIVEHRSISLTCGYSTMCDQSSATGTGGLGVGNGQGKAWGREGAECAQQSVSSLTYNRPVYTAA
jgi:hypothetical protein